MPKDSQPDNKKARTAKANGNTPITRENQNHNKNAKKQSIQHNDVQTGGFNMAKAGMRRPDPKAPHGTEGRQKMNIPKNNVAPVPELQGKAKSGKKKASIIQNRGIYGRSETI